MLLFSVTSCLDGHDEKIEDILKAREQAGIDISLDLVKARDTLVALTDYNSTNYFIYRGEPMGYQFEMIKQFADHLGVNLKLVVVNEMDRAFQLLNKNKVD